MHQPNGIAPNQCRSRCPAWLAPTSVSWVHRVLIWPKRCIRCKRVVLCLRRTFRQSRTTCVLWPIAFCRTLLVSTNNNYFWIIRTKRSVEIVFDYNIKKCYSHRSYGRRFFHANYHCHPDPIFDSQTHNHQPTIIAVRPLVRAAGRLVCQNRSALDRFSGRPFRRPHQIRTVRRRRTHNAVATRPFVQRPKCQSTIHTYRPTTGAVNQSRQFTHRAVRLVGGKSTAHARRRSTISAEYAFLFDKQSICLESGCCKWTEIRRWTTDADQLRWSGNGRFACDCTHFEFGQRSDWPFSVLVFVAAGRRDYGVDDVFVARCESDYAECEYTCF